MNHSHYGARKERCRNKAAPNVEFMLALLCMNHKWHLMDGGVRWQAIYASKGWNGQVAVVSTS